MYSFCVFSSKWYYKFSGHDSKCHDENEKYAHRRDEHDENMKRNYGSQLSCPDVIQSDRVWHKKRSHSCTAEVLTIRQLDVECVSERISSFKARFADIFLLILNAEDRQISFKLFNC